MESARKLAEEWVAAWNARDLEAVMSHYAPDVVFESPRVAAAFTATGGQVGSPDGVLRGTPSLRPYFAQGISALPHLRLELQRVLEGPPGGWYGVQYTRESGALVVETVRLAAAAGGGEEAEAGAVKQGEAVAAGVAGGKVVGAGGDAGSGGGGSGSAGRNGGGRLRIVEARVFYEHVC